MHGGIIHSVRAGTVEAVVQTGAEGVSTRESPVPGDARGERVFLTAEWRFLAMLNYRVDPELLRPYLPRGVELDTWEGETLMSVVGFMFLNTRVWGAAIPLHRDFEEVNLRFYVRRRGPEGWRQSVVFIKEIVPKWPVAAVARLLYNEQYVALPMTHAIDRTGHSLVENGEVEYRWLSGKRWTRMRVRTSGQPRPLEPGSQEEFVAEHYWGHSRQRDGGCIEYRVEHPPWQVWQTSEAVLEGDVGAVYGPELAAALQDPPVSAFVADGSPVLVRSGYRIG